MTTLQYLPVKLQPTSSSNAIAIYNGKWRNQSLFADQIPQFEKPSESKLMTALTSGGFKWKRN